MEGRASEISPSTLIYPLFIGPTLQDLSPALPNQWAVGVSQLEAFLKPLIQAGLSTVLLFGHGAPRDTEGTSADSPTAPLLQAIRLLKAKFPSLVVVCDVCLCAYVTSGCCGIVHPTNSHTIDTWATLKRLGQIAVAYAEAGADVIAPSDMQDCTVMECKRALFAAGLGERTALMSYSAKFCSCLYGPFRAVQKGGLGGAECRDGDSEGRAFNTSEEKALNTSESRKANPSESRMATSDYPDPTALNKSEYSEGRPYPDSESPNPTPMNSSDSPTLTYPNPTLLSRATAQLPFGAMGLAMRALHRDIEEGADILMIKPAGFCGDVVREAKALFPAYPIAAFQTAGEYAMIHWAAENGAFSKAEAVRESIQALLRAGAGIVVSYWVPQLLLGRWVGDWREEKRMD